ncbi:MAG: hypothetical protein ACRD4C_06070 [Candidatus Acidiferrales bacterium]
MQNRMMSLLISLLLGLSCGAIVRAQSEQPGATKNQSAQTPDLSGVWGQRRPPASAGQYWVYEFSTDEPPMTPWGEEQYKAAKPSFGPHSFSIAETNDPVYHGCFPPGVPRIYLHPFPMQIIQTGGEVVMLFEYDQMRRQIYIDGRAHDSGVGPTWMGDSIGHWEGDTLVVDSTNFNDKTWLDRIGHPHSDQLHLVERIRRPDHDTLVDDITIEDPKAYTKPWTAHLYYDLKPTWKLMEQFCEDNDTFLKFEKKETVPGSGKN